MKFFRTYHSLFLFFFLLFPLLTYSQDQNKIDSLENLLKIVKDDTGKAIILTDIAMELRFVDPELSLKKVMEAIEICKKIKYKKGLGKSLNVAGLSYNALGNYESAVEYHNYAMNTFLENNDSIGIAKAFHNIGYAYGIIGKTDSTLKYFMKSKEIAELKKDYSLANFNNSKIAEIYAAMGDYPKALEYSHSSLTLSEMANDIEGQSNALNEIGLILLYQKNFNASLDYFNRSRILSEKISDRSYLAANLNNLGLLHEKMNKREEAIQYYLESLWIKEEIGNLQSVAISYSNMARLYQDNGDYRKAAEYNRKALAIDKQLDDKQGLCIDYLQLSGVEIILKNFPEAENLIEMAMKIAINSGYKDLQINSYSAMADLYARQNKFEEAFKYHKLFSQTKDSLLNSENNKQIAEMQTKYESEKKQKEIELLNKEKIIQEVELEKTEAEVKKQNTQKIAFGTGFALVLVLALVVFRGYKQKEKSNLLLAKQKQQIEIKNSHLEEANTEINKQKNEIEEKNHEILASIRYAQRIQEAILPPSKYVKSYLKHSFILYKPKDIVAGDFYWMHAAKKLAGNEMDSGIVVNNDLTITESEKRFVLFAACDCTGHGVPGAFVSIVGHNALNRAVKEFGLVKPSEILDKVNELVEETFSKSENSMKDGMDIALCKLFLANDKWNLEYSGANNSMYIISNGELKEIRADKQPIGHFIERKPFTNHSVELNPGDCLYVFSDGYADQFGGPKGKKFKYSQFEKLLISVHQKSMEEQREILNDEIEKWKGTLEQIDDICIIGVKV